MEEDDNHHPHHKLRHQRGPSPTSVADKPSKPRLRGLLLDPAGVDAGSLEAKLDEGSAPSRFGSLVSGLQAPAIIFLLFFAFLAVWRWVFLRRGSVTIGYSCFSPNKKKQKKKNKKTGSGHCSDDGSHGGSELDPGPLDDLESQARSNPTSHSHVVKYAEKPTIRQGLRTCTGSRAKRREPAKVFGLSSYPGAAGRGDDVEAGGTNTQPSPPTSLPRPRLSLGRAPSLPSPRPSPPSPRPSPPPRPSIDEVLQNSVRGFREPWWETLSKTEDGKDARDSEVERSYGGIAGCDMPPETQAFLDYHVAHPPNKISSRACPAVKEEQEQDMCLLLLSPSAVNATTAAAAGIASHDNFATQEEEKTGQRARAETMAIDNDMDMESTLKGFLAVPTERNDMASSILAGFLPGETDGHYDMAGSSILTGFSPGFSTDNHDSAGAILAEISSETTVDGNGMAGSSILAGLSPETMTDIDDMVGSSILAGFSPAVASPTPMFERPAFFQTLSLVGEGEEKKEEEETEEESGVVLSQVGSSRSSPPRQGFAFPPPPPSSSSSPLAAVHTVSLADVRTVSLADGVIEGAEPEIIGYESYGHVSHVDSGGDARSGGSGRDSFVFRSSEEDEDEVEDEEEEGEEVQTNSLPLPAPAVVVPTEEDRADMTTRLVEVLRGLDDQQVATAATREEYEYLARNCSLSRSEDNLDLTWHEVLGEGKFGRVSAVLHEFGRYAVKELMEEAGEDERQSARNEMETILSVSDHRHIIQAVAMDLTLPSMPIMMEAGSGDMFTVMHDATMSMPAKIRLLRETACGLNHVFSKGKVHRDVKAGNVIVVGGGDESTLTAKVADFGMTCAIGAYTAPRTGSPGYVPVENLGSAIEAGPDGDVFSFAVLMLYFFFRNELRENNMFAHSLVMTDDERMELEEIYNDGGDAQEIFHFQCAVQERAMYDGSFDETMLLPERLDDRVPNKPRVCEWLWRCLSTDRGMRPSMEAVAGMLEDLLDIDDD